MAFLILLLFLVNFESPISTEKGKKTNVDVYLLIIYRRTRYVHLVIAALLLNSVFTAAALSIFFPPLPLLFFW